MQIDTKHRSTVLITNIQNFRHLLIAMYTRAHLFPTINSSNVTTTARNKCGIRDVHLLERVIK